MKHPGTTPSKCDHCGEVFKNAWGLKIHVSRKHGPNAGRPHIRRATKPRASNHSFSARYCPNCGCPLLGVGPGIEAAARMNGGAS